MHNITRTPITDASAWRGEHRVKDTSWITHLHPGHIAEIDAALAKAMAGIANGSEVTQLLGDVYDEDLLSSRCSRNTIESARKMGIAQYTDLKIEALLYLDRRAAHPDLRLDMDLERGDMQFINNYTTLHSRTEYLNHDDRKIRRHMVRLWLN